MDEHPDIPVIVNEDMEGLPTEALHGGPAALKAIKEHTAVVRRQLVATGARTQQWVDEHLPQPQSSGPRRHQPGTAPRTSAVLGPSPTSVA